jgi:hypothetical protein
VGVSKPNSSAACSAHACENENGKAEREERGAISDWIFDLYVSDASPLNVEHALEVDKGKSMECHGWAPVPRNRSVEKLLAIGR